MSYSKQSVFVALYVLSVLVLSASGEEVFESRSGIIQELRTALADLAGEGRTYFGSLAGNQTLMMVQRAFSKVLSVVAGGLAGGLSVVLQHLSDLLQAAGLHVKLPFNRVTPEGLVFVAQWVLVAGVCYWLISLAFQLIASTLWQALRLLKIAVALACFGLILSDHRVGTETMVFRVAALVCVCILLGIGTSSGSNAGNKITHLEEHVKILERRLKEMERWTRTED
ncbi:voltage-gated monoatomic cation channel TMEM109 [Parambassis ranga]|uniref:Voltage-gated monoatomic cation channel TMEM109 n=1 Tax=Parambassis ranga TaxID=210632 RepID=A0A6P7I2Z3_9TELE|nr:uncharacterized protein LOC114436302 [Parambassis ranga]